MAYLAAPVTLVGGYRALGDLVDQLWPVFEFLNMRDGARLRAVCRELRRLVALYPWDEATEILGRARTPPAARSMLAGVRASFARARRFNLSRCIYLMDGTLAVLGGMRTLVTLDLG